MKPQSSALQIRAAACNAAVQAYSGRPFKWGRFDCGRLATLVLRKLGYAVPTSKFGKYSSEDGARAALAAGGFDDMPAALDSFGLARIGHASSLPGDLVGLAAIDGLTSIALVLPNWRILGFVEDECRVLKPLAPIGLCWRCDPCRR